MYSKCFSLFASSIILTYIIHSNNIFNNICRNNILNDYCNCIKHVHFKIKRSSIRECDTFIYAVMTSYLQSDILIKTQMVLSLKSISQYFCPFHAGTAAQALITVGGSHVLQTTPSCDINSF